MDLTTVYTDLDDLPLDSPPEDQGDAGPPKEALAAGDPDEHRARLLQVEQQEVLRPDLLVLGAAKGPHIIVPFGRILFPGMIGPDVTGVHRALARADVLPWHPPFSNKLDAVTDKALKVFQARHGIQATGRYGKPTHKALAPFFDRFAFKLYVGYKPPKPRPTNPWEAVEQELYAEMLWSYNHRDQYHYHQWRPIPHLHDPFFLPENTDCSGGCTQNLSWAHGPDPNRNGWNGQGFTGSIAAGCRHIAPNMVVCGCMGLYGAAPNYEHVVMFLGQMRGGIPLVWSNGSEGGPYISPANYRGWPDLYVSPFPLLPVAA